MKTLNILLGSLLLVGMGCGTKQDPMAGKPQAVRDGRLPVQKVQLPPPKDSEAVRINTVDFITFKENEENRIPVVVNVLENNYKVIYEVVNQSEFPGSVIDPLTGDFVWTPPKGFVFGGTQSEDTLTVDMKLQIRAIGTHESSADAIVYTRERTVNVSVQKFKGAPTMTVTGLTDKTGGKLYFEEDTDYEFEVKIIDEDAGPRMESQPRLDILAVEDQAISLAPFIKIDTIKRNYKTREYTYQLVLNLGRSNLTANSSKAGFGLRATSRFNVSTSLFSYESAVLAKFGDLDITWKDQVEMIRGTKVVVPFLVYEATSRASFKAETEGMPLGANIKCETYSTKGIMPCKFIWAIPANMPESYGKFLVRIVAHSDNYSTQINSVTREFEISFKVTFPTLTNPGNGPTPIPTPAPVPIGVHSTAKESL